MPFFGISYNLFTTRCPLFSFLPATLPLTACFLNYCREPVHIFIINIHGGFFTHGGEPLLAIRGHPNGIAFFYRIPLMIEHIHALSLQVQQTMFHDMRFYKW